MSLVSRVRRAKEIAMAAARGGVYADYNELVAAVAKKTKLEPEKVKEVLTASFASTRSWVLSEVNKRPFSEVAARDRVSKLNR